MSVIVKGGSSNILADVTADKAIKISNPTDPTLAGYVKMLDGSGDPTHTTESGALLTSDERIVFFDPVDGAAVNINLWNQSNSGMTITQANGLITLNATSAVTANAYSIISSIKYMPMYGPLPLRILMTAKVNVIPQANLTIELGLASGATNAAPTDGVFFRWAPNGNFLAVVNNAGTETTSVVTPAPVATHMVLFEFIIVEDLVIFRMDDVTVATVENPVSIAFPTNAARIPLFVRVYNSASVPSMAPQIAIGGAFVVQQDMGQNKSWGEVLACLGRGFYQSPVTPFAQTANHANSVAPTAVTLSNTTAGYATLGGQFAVNSQAAGAIDGIVFAYQNETGYQRTIKGIQISTAITGIAVVTAALLEWTIGVNSSAVSLATVDGVGTWAPRCIPIGIQTFLALAAIGTQPSNINVAFDPPLMIDSGRYFHVILRTPNGAATGSLIYRGTVTILGGYSE